MQGVEHDNVRNTAFGGCIEVNTRKKVFLLIYIKSILPIACNQQAEIAHNIKE